MGIKYLIDEPRLRHGFQINVLCGRGKFYKTKSHEEIGKKFNITDTKKIFIYDFCMYQKILSGFGLICDNLEDAIIYEPNHWFIKNEI